MKKILLSIVFIFSALWAGLTWFAASKTEDVFNKMLVESNQQLAESTAMLSMQKQSFKKGFISSHAKSIIHIRPELLNDAFAIPLEHEIYHGPLMATSAGLKVGTSYIVTSLDLGALNPEKQGIINQVFAGKQALFSTTQTNFDGSFTEFFEISPLTIDAAIFATLFQLPQSKGSDFNLSLAGIKGEFSSTAKNDYLYANVSTGLLNLSGHDNGENFNLRVAEARVSLDIDELYKGMMLLGRSSLEIPAIHFKSHAGSFSLIDTALTMTMKEQADDYLENFSLEINKIRLKTRKITLPESQLKMTFALNGLDKEAFKQLVDISHSIRKALVGQASSQVEQQLYAYSKEYLYALNNIFQPDLTSQYSLELSNVQGASKMHANISYTADQKLLKQETLKDLIKAFSAELELDLDQKLLRNLGLSQSLRSPIAMGIMTNSGTSYRSTAKLENAQLTLNDEIIPFLESLGPVADEPIDWDALLN